MIYRILADLVLLVHALFIVFAVFGGLLGFWRRWVVWLHLPAMAWGALVVAMGWVCPLTPLETSLRQMAGQQAYGGSFIEHYLLLMIYPPGLTRSVQALLAALLIGGNAAVYLVLCRRWRGSPKKSAGASRR
ncbi:DUF2784 domain-containing protein [Verticiella sediminum]|uniref:DUF2784 domain-containing protein n=1 Tax=Verticiella sediminum TaxID=1247510 RepID=A0A556ALV2_9BURK|nr:DUF2784 domain-containing protein [Verticiella sediminum]TSH93874.1 DUF2784 domain-containing protein [Verticiella sediminum]